MPRYESVQTIQEAINMAVGEKRIVRFISEKSNLELRKGIVDIKGCKLRKPSKESIDIAVIPPMIDAEAFTFEDVDTKIEVVSPKIWVPR